MRWSHTRIHRHCSKPAFGSRKVHRKGPLDTRTIWPPPQGHRRPEFSGLTGVWSETPGHRPTSKEVS